jgi:MoaA/NifB/PqqE/SkfB family radical SAM enzyme
MARFSVGQMLGFQARALRAFLASRFIAHRPFLLSHLITTACNASCPYCYWKSSREDELTTDEIIKLYGEARREGFFINAIWGGEPLLRSDLAAVAKFSADLGFFTVVFTNGYLLADRHEFAEYPDALILSLDDTEDRHDRLRGVEGLFERALDGVAVVRKRHPKTYIAINCLLSRLNRGAAERVIHLGREIDLPVFFSPVLDNADASFCPASESPPDLTAAGDTLAEEFAVVRGYKERGYRINTSYLCADYFIGKRRHYRCHWPKIRLDVSSRGDVGTCLSSEGFGNIRDRSLREILRSQSFKDRLAELRGCSRACQWSDSIEGSALYGFSVPSLMNSAVIYRDVLDINLHGRR